MDNYTGCQIGNYRILRELGAGGFATVYLAEHIYIEKLAAIKMLHVAMEPQSHQKFQKEARINARLEHPHIVRVLDFGFYEQMPYLVMEYAPMGTLRSLHPMGTRVPLQQIVYYVRQIAQALDYAHQQQVIHRDVKPENLLLNTKNEIILSDFGIAVLQQAQASPSARKIVGTPLYMAPEQFRGNPQAASDQYALGVIVYEWLCGEPPFSGDMFALFHQHIKQPPRSLHERMPDISPAVDKVVLTTLAKNPAQRFACVEDFASALEKAAFTMPSTLIGGQVGGPENKEPEFKHFTQSRLKRVQLTQNQHVQAANQEAAFAKEKVPLPQAAATNGALMGTQEATPVGTPPSSSPLSNKERLWLLRRVRSFWIAGVLQQSLAGAEFMELDLQVRPDAVVNPWKQVLPAPTTPHIKAERKSILQFYNDAGSDLLILGAPGSGKTTHLLMLARDLLALAEQDEKHPIPVVFNLSTWSNKKTLATWLVEELQSKYQVQKKLGQQLVRAQMILPLLDGLDEVAPTERTACIETVNEYRRKYSLSPLVVCSRSVDYLSQEARLILNNAVMIQPLSMQQANEYLVQAGEPLRALQIAVQKESSLRELMRTPLLLRMLALTYYNASVSDILRASSPDEQIQQVLERYVERMLARGSDKASYTLQSTKHWLSWLARQMQRHNQKIFYLERIQPDYAEQKTTRQRYLLLTIGLIFGLLTFFGLAGPLWLDGITFSILSPTPRIAELISAALFFIPVSALLVGLINGMLYRQHPKNISDSLWRRRWRGTGQRIVRGMVNIGLIGLVVGPPFCWLVLFAGSFTTLEDSSILHGLIVLAIESLTIGAIGALMLFLLDLLLNIQTSEIQPAELVVWSWRRMLRNFFKYLFIGFLFNLPLGAIGVVLSLRVSSTSAALSSVNAEQSVSTTASVITIAALIVSVLTVVVLPIFIFLFALLKGITGGFSANALDTRDIATPNQGIRNSARYSLQTGLVSSFFLIVIPVAAAALLLFNGYFIAYLLLVALFNVAPLLVLILVLRIGGVTCIQHYMLRWLLRRDGVMPWNAVRFLDYCAEHILLQKVGGGYMFVHRFLLEYFASLEAPPSR
jgi:serine/threonine protein kinase/DNA polymerase III delta prime subunit